MKESVLSVEKNQFINNLYMYINYIIIYMYMTLRFDAPLTIPPPSYPVPALAAVSLAASF